MVQETQEIIDKKLFNPVRTEEKNQKVLVTFERAAK